MKCSLVVAAYAKLWRLLAILEVDPDPVSHEARRYSWHNPPPEFKISVGIRRIHWMVHRVHQYLLLKPLDLNACAVHGLYSKQ